MNGELNFCLSGCGYLKDIITEEGRFVARIKVVHLSPSKDEIWIDAEVEEHDKQVLLTRYLSKVRAGKNVLLSFEVEYRTLINVFSGCTSDDPDNIVTIGGELNTLRRCYNK